jgi:amino acid adenylation domain-containing protein
VHELFEEQVERTPQAVAVVCGEKELSYEELNRRANRLAHYLRGLGVQPDTRVGICCERGIEMMVGLLGVLKSGAAYVPLDPTYPPDRLHFVLRDCASEVLLTQANLQEQFSAMRSGAKLVSILDINDAVAVGNEREESNVKNDAIRPRPENLAYVIYTSGSTGMPKAVMVEHRALVNILESVAREIEINETDRLLACTTISFDIAALELFAPLLKGGCVVLSTGEKGAMQEVAYRAQKGDITIIQATPTLWNIMMDEWTRPGRMKILCGGEALDAATAQRLLRTSPAVWNMYGPTETTIWSMMHPVTEAGSGVVTIGHPVSNTQIYVLDRRGEPVPIGVAGEIYIGGAGVARGYLNRPELTAERFVPNPYAEEGGARMYRTGDLGKWLRDGNIEFLGRNDFQVKLRGFRIELGEIEARLLEHEGMKEAVVVAREDEIGEKQLVAYYTCGKGEEIGAEELGRHLRERLPEYMVPAAFVHLDELPMTANGKLDRKALPRPEAGAFGLGGYVEPRNPTEELLAGIWAEVLRLPQVGVEDNFFSMGGHSLLGLQVVSRMRDIFRMEIPLRWIFEFPTVAGLADNIKILRTGEDLLSGREPIKRIPRDQYMPLSSNQEAMLFREWLASMSSVQPPPFHMAVGLRLRGELCYEALQNALNEIITRHEVLRTAFSGRNKKVPLHELPRLLQKFQAPAVAETTSEEAQKYALFSQNVLSGVHLDLPSVDLQPLGATQREAEVRKLCMQEVATPFDYEKPPLLRALLIKTKMDEHLLVTTIHHLVADRWSAQIFQKELISLYRRFAENSGEALPELPIQYADFANWQQSTFTGERLEKLISYWRQRWHNYRLFDVERLPFTHPELNKPNFRTEMEYMVIDENFHQKLKTFASEHGLSMYMLLLGAVYLLLHTHSGETRIALWGNFANRTRRETEGVIGWFANSHLLGVEIEPESTISELLARVRETVLDASAHQELPNGALWTSVLQNLERAPRTRRVFDEPHIRFDLAGEVPGPAAGDGLAFERTAVPEPDTSGVAMHMVAGGSSELNIRVKYSQERFERIDVQSMLLDLKRVLQKIVTAPESRISALRKETDVFIAAF